MGARGIQLRNRGLAGSKRMAAVEDCFKFGARAKVGVLARFVVRFSDWRGRHLSATELTGRHIYSSCSRCYSSVVVLVVCGALLDDK